MFISKYDFFFSRISEHSCYSNFVSHIQALGTYSTEKLYQMQCTIILKNCLRDLTEEFRTELRTGWEKELV